MEVQVAHFSVNSGLRRCFGKFAGFSLRPAPTEIPDGPNFAAAIGNRPFMMIMGRQDTMCAVEKAQALFDVIPPRRKLLLFLDAGHRLPPDYFLHAVSWITANMP